MVFFGITRYLIMRILTNINVIATPRPILGKILKYAAAGTIKRIVNIKTKKSM